MPCRLPFLPAQQSYQSKMARGKLQDSSSSSLTRLRLQVSLVATVSRLLAISLTSLWAYLHPTYNSQSSLLHPTSLKSQEYAYDFSETRISTVELAHLTKLDPFHITVENTPMFKEVQDENPHLAIDVHGSSASRVQSLPSFLLTPRRLTARGLAPPLFGRHPSGAAKGGGRMETGNNAYGFPAPGLCPRPVSAWSPRGPEQMSLEATDEDRSDLTNALARRPPATASCVSSSPVGCGSCSPSDSCAVRDSACSCDASLSLSSALPRSPYPCTRAGRRLKPSIHEAGLDPVLWRLLVPFLSWDGEYFVSVALQKTAYFFEHTHAFFPGLSAVYVFLNNLISVRQMRSTESTCSSLEFNRMTPVSGRSPKAAPATENTSGPLGELTETRGLFMPLVARLFVFLRNLTCLNEQTRIALLAFLLSNTLFVFATLGVFEVARLLSQGLEKEKIGYSTSPSCGDVSSLSSSGDAISALSFQESVWFSSRKTERQAWVAACWFSFSAASIHMSATYTETLFACLSSWGLVLLLSGERAFLQRFACSWLATLLFCLASFLRSNGTLALAPLFFHTVRTCPLLRFLFGRRATEATGKTTAFRDRTGHGQPTGSVSRPSDKQRGSPCFAACTKKGPSSFGACKSEGYGDCRGKVDCNDGHSLSGGGNRRGAHRATAAAVVHWSMALLQAIVVVLPTFLVMAYPFYLYCACPVGSCVDTKCIISSYLFGRDIPRTLEHQGKDSLHPARVSDEVESAAALDVGLTSSGTDDHGCCLARSREPSSQQHCKPFLTFARFARDVVAVGLPRAMNFASILLFQTVFSSSREGLKSRATKLAMQLATNVAKLSPTRGGGTCARAEYPKTYSAIPGWCLDRIPSVYPSIQREYWNVYVFGFLEAKKLYLILLSLPYYFLAASCILFFLHQLCHGEEDRHAPDDCGRDSTCRAKCGHQGETTVCHLSSHKDGIPSVCPHTAFSSSMPQSCLAGVVSSCQNSTLSRSASSSLTRTALSLTQPEGRDAAERKAGGRLWGELVRGVAVRALFNKATGDIVQLALLAGFMFLCGNTNGVAPDNRATSCG
ncbi:phosphatidylinositol glycan class related protein [Cystoisospora suis]|uniref:Phosphatidylinositol glycan class related protein n=1 Tax=Cystoisospora suis TaxID=483139 RepID=A0A2C6KYL6_9APIC|nr:phosphatidylinositol glycan class related protein [Cystoisospora suis]